MMKRKQPIDDTTDIVAKMSKLQDDSSVSVSEKQQRYDRQLRLWGDHGQQALEKASVCLIHANAVGTEALKCLVLPGIGSFTVVDGNDVTSEDISNNFFLDSSSLGKSRAEEACKNLMELNDEVKGDALNAEVLLLINDDPSYFEKFTVVMASGLPESFILMLSTTLWKAGVPLVLLESVGFFGYARLVIPEHTVVETHPDNILEDLRLDKPFDGLKDYMDSMHMDSMTRLEHSHTPFLVIIYKALQRWTNQNSKWPTSYKEKKEIKDIISEGIRPKENENEEEEENFEEALKNVNNVLVQTKVPSSVQEVLSEAVCTHTNKNSKFWIMARAVAEFVKIHGSLPVRGSIPDMFSDSERFIKLQTIYREKAMSDADEVYSILKEQTKCCDGKSITLDEVRYFCKNSHQLYVSNAKPLTCEFLSEEGSSHLAQYAEDEETYPDFKLYSIFRGLMRFMDDCQSYPRRPVPDSANDISLLKGLVQNINSSLGGSITDVSTYVDEVVRCNLSELHAVSSVLGGLAAHEVIKVITKQFIPINNCFLYNAMCQTTLTLSLP